MIGDVASRLQGLVGGLFCTCPMCERHGQIHRQVPRTLLGRSEEVDAEMAPLLDVLGDRGVMSVASCVDLADAVEQMAPAMLPRIVAQHGQPGLHYGTVAARRWAFVRVVDTAAAEPFLDLVEQVGGEVTGTGLIAQAAFPQASLGRLTWSL